MNKTIAINPELFKLSNTQKKQPKPDLLFPFEILIMLVLFCLGVLPKEEFKSVVTAALPLPGVDPADPKEAGEDENDGSVC